MLAEIELGWSIETQVKALDNDAYHLVREGAPFLDLPLDREAKWDAYKAIHNRTVIDLTREGALLVEHGLRFEIKRFKGCRKVASEGTVNIQVAIPNLLLFAVDEVMVVEDECTDRLQGHLNEGWRILAVCPPANQRRPDYVLGRQKETARD